MKIIKEFPGIFGIINWILGYFPDGKDEEGNPLPSRGTTTMFLTSLPLVFMCTMYGTSMLRANTAISKSSLHAYSICMTKIKNIIHEKRCKPLLTKQQKSKAFEGKWPWITCLAFFSIGALFNLLTREQDFRRFKELGVIAASAMNNKVQIPKIIENAFSSIGKKTILSNAKPEDPEDAAQ